MPTTDLGRPLPPRGVATTRNPVRPTPAPSVHPGPPPPLDEQFLLLLDRLLDEDRPELLDWITDHVVRRAYVHGRGSQVQAAKRLGISRNVFRTLMKRAGLLSGEGRIGRLVEEAHHHVLNR